LKYSAEQPALESLRRAGLIPQVYFLLIHRAKFSMVLSGKSKFLPSLYSQQAFGMTL